MAQQTAVEFLIESIDARGLWTKELRKEAKQAKQMFEEQIIDAHLTGLIRPLEIEATKQAQHYYNETYGNNQNK